MSVSETVDDGGRIYPTVCPYVYYRDGVAALEFLVKAFGFRERMRSSTDGQSIGHAEVELGGSVVMLGDPPEHRPPDVSGEQWGGLYVHVEDVDAHYAHAMAAGARTEGPPQDQPYGVRHYAAFDTEGNRWWFAQPLSG